MNKYKFKKHLSKRSPFSTPKTVVYRTIDIDGNISHIHAPISSERINWDHTPKFGCIYEYAVV